MPNHATAIEWMTALADSRGMRAAVYNPIRGCKPAGDGCRNCWAAEVAVRRANHPNAAIRARHEGLAYRASDGRAVFNGTWRFIDDQLDLPLRTRKPTAYFVGSETDLFGEGVPDEWLDKVFAVMALCPQHLFLVLTKRPERMRGYMAAREPNWQVALSDANPPGTLPITKNDIQRRLGVVGKFSDDQPTPTWPLPNLWLGCSIWDQDSADRFIPPLLGTPAALYFVSAEPMLGEVRLDHIDVGEDTTINALAGYGRDPYHGEPVKIPRLGWVIAGGESGTRARPCHPDWARDIRDQCQAVGVPFFWKQNGTWAVVYDRVDDPDWRRCPSARDNNERYVNLAGGHGFHGERAVFARKVRKKAAGRLLDGRVWAEVPHV